MGTARRRSLLKGFLALPIVSSFAKLDTLGQFSRSVSSTKDDPHYDQKYLAVLILRHINTAQAWHYLALGRYAEIKELNTSSSMSALVTSEKAASRGIGGPLHARLNFDGKEIVPGWKFALSARQDRLGYVASVNPVQPELLPAFSTDEAGIIFEGHPLTSDILAMTGGAEALLGSPAPIKSSPSSPSWFASLVMSLAFVPPFLCACRYCTQYPCCCDPCCLCGPDCVSGCTGSICVNCGCVGCTYCCC